MDSEDSRTSLKIIYVFKRHCEMNSHRNCNWVQEKVAIPLSAPDFIRGDDKYGKGHF